MGNDPASKTSDVSYRRSAPKFCKHCHYPLRGLDPIGQCPECGETYNVSRRWTYTFDAQPESLGIKVRTALGRPIFPLIALGIWPVIYSEGLSFWFVITYPMWLIVASFLILDFYWQMHGLPNRYWKAVCDGVIVGVALTYLGMWLFAESINHWHAIIGATFGFLGSILLIRAEANDLRA